MTITIKFDRGTPQAKINPIVSAVQQVTTDEVVVERHPIDVLIDKLNADPYFERGVLTSDAVEELVASGVSVSFEVIDQVRINSVDVNVCADQGLDIDEEVSDHWHDHLLSNEVIEDLGDLLIVFAFGLLPDKAAIDAVLSGQLKIDGLDDEGAQLIFSDYRAFLTRLFGANYENVLEYDITIGNDS